MTEWCTIESDPGVFTELIRNIGVKNVQVEEILDLDQLNYIDQNIYGLVFLFKYIHNSGYQPNIMTNWDEDLYFAKQVIVNACATQALLGILMNNDDNLEIGSDLTELKSFTKLMDPYMKGLCISNCEKVRIEHNKFAKPEPFVFSQKRKATEEDEVFHYVSYIHFKNNIYEIDGLQEGPILLAENVSPASWIDKLKPIILNRINLYANNEIKFNLLALVPDRREKLIAEERELVKRIEYINRILTNTISEDVDMEFNFNEYDAISHEELLNIISELNINLEQVRMNLYEENVKFEKYKIENQRRQHNYIPLIFELLKVMSEKKQLDEICKEVIDGKSK